MSKRTGPRWLKELDPVVVEYSVYKTINIDCGGWPHATRDRTGIRSAVTSPSEGPQPHRDSTQPSAQPPRQDGVGHCSPEPQQVHVSHDAPPYTDSTRPDPQSRGQAYYPGDLPSSPPALPDIGPVLSPPSSSLLDAQDSPATMPQVSQGTENPGSNAWVQGRPTPRLEVFEWNDDMEPIEPYQDEYREQKIINEEYKIWKKNSPLLYDMLFARALSWPTLTLQWFPDKKAVPDTNYSQHRILFATHTSGEATNYLQIASLEVPDLPKNNLANYNEERGEIGGPGHAKKPFEWHDSQKIPVKSEVNKARYQPQNPNIIASTCADAKVLIFDRTKHPSHPKDEKVFQYEMELVGHAQEGFGLSWNPHREGVLVTGTEDSTVRLWDIKNGFTKGNKQIQPTTTYNYHSATVNDVDHHPQHNFWVGTVSDDLSFKVIDTRESPSSKPAKDRPNAHTDAINCVAFNPHPSLNMVVVTGSADKSIAAWDLRNLSKKTHSFEFHRDEVISLQWHPQDPTWLASSSNDRRICFWSMADIGKEQTPEEAEDGPPELGFMHGGFTNRVSDFSWNLNDPWVMAAAAEDNQVQVFRPSRSLVQPRKKKPARAEVSD